MAEQVRRYPHVMEAVFGRPWAIQPEKLEAIAEVIRARLDAFNTLEPIEIEASAKPVTPTAKGIAVIPVYGTLLYRVGAMEAMSGATSTQAVGRAVRAAADDAAIGRIVLDIDSPGGQTDGVTEAAAIIRAAREKKPVTAVANTLMASAAYALGSQASELVASPSAMVGSIGVYMMHVDASGFYEMSGVKPTYVSAPAGGYKTELAGDQPLNEESRAHLQSIVDDAYATFVRDVSRGRGVSEATVKADYGKGRVYPASEAKARGMVDRIETLDDVLSRLSGGRVNGSRSRAERERVRMG